MDCFIQVQNAENTWLDTPNEMWPWEEHSLSERRECVTVIQCKYIVYIYMQYLYIYLHLDLY